MRHRKSVIALVLMGAVVLGTSGSKVEGCSGGGSSQPAPDPSEKYEYQCSDGSYHIGRKALDKYRETHPNVICKRVK